MSLKEFKQISKYLKIIKLKDFRTEDKYKNLTEDEKGLCSLVDLDIFLYFPESLHKDFLDFLKIYRKNFYNEIYQSFNGK